MTVPVPGSFLEENLGRVIDSVVRNVDAGRGAVPDTDLVETKSGTNDDVVGARETMADLCGHVAYALKSLETGPQVLASYRAPEPPSAPPTLNLIR